MLFMKSIWEKNVDMPLFSALEQDISTQVLVIGGGLAGLLCAYRLSQQGIDCVLIEADQICRKVSGHTTAKVTSQHGLVYHKLLRRYGARTARLYWLMNQEAITQYSDLSRELDFDFQKANNYIFDSGDPEKMTKELEALSRLEIPASFVRPLPTPTGEQGGICFPDQAQLHPMKLALELSRKLRIYEHTPARELMCGQVRTGRGNISAEQIILATHYPILNKHGLYPLKLYQHRSYVLALEGVGALEGMYLDEAKNGFSFRSSGDCLLLGGGGHRTGKESNGWADLEAFAREHYPEAKELARWATQDCMSLDAMPYIGAYSRGTEGLYVATGFNKWGMTSAMAASMILSDLIEGKENPYAQVVDPSRTMLHPQLAMNGLEAAVNLLTPTRPRCPHLGCALKWNPQEHSWDCPCHGSRFTKEGRLLENPSTGDLNP